MCPVGSAVEVGKEDGEEPVPAGRRAGGRGGRSGSPDYPLPLGISPGGGGSARLYNPGAGLPG